MKLNFGLISTLICSFIAFTETAAFGEIAGGICAIISCIVSCIWVVVKIITYVKDGKITQEEKKDIEDSIKEINDGDSR